MDAKKIAEAVTKRIEDGGIIRVEYGYAWWFVAGAEQAIADAISQAMNESSDSSTKDQNG